MPKPKRAKLNSGHDARNIDTTDQALSYEEIWDDSALIRSWDDAVAEYKYYHSIHASGEDIEDILRKAEVAEAIDAFDDPTSLNPDDALVAAEQAGNIADYEEGEIEHEHSKQAVGVDTVPGSLNPGAQATTAITEQTETVGKRVFHGPYQPGAVATSSKANAYSVAPTQISTAARSNQKPQSTEQASDQTLENIKMAYYWAGYYSGLYDGQRQQS